MSERVEVEDSLEAVTSYLYERRMTDGLPVVPPTEERVAAMVSASSRHRDDVIGDLPPANAPATVEKIAINSVMAGCEPGYMPTIIATVEALLEPRFNAHSVQTTTNSVGAMIILNGPIRQKLGINCGTGCLGPGTKANATIGRALRLIMLNIGSATVGDVDKSTLGWPGKSTSCCFGENEEESPWESLHVELGYRETDSTVTLFPANGMWPITDVSPESETVLHVVTHGMSLTGPAPAPNPAEQALIVNPVWAKLLAAVKPAKKELKEHLLENAKVPLDWAPPSRRQGALERLESFGLAVEDGMVPMIGRVENLLVLVAGGQGSLHGCGVSTRIGRSVTKKIEDA